MVVSVTEFEEKIDILDGSVVYAIMFRAVNKVLEHNYLYILVERNVGISKLLEVSRMLI